MGQLAKGTFPPELWDWAMGQIPRIAAKCDRAFRQDIEAQLAIKFLQISRNVNLRADDWKKYIYVSLSNRAVYLAKAWHKKRSLETALDAYAEIPAAVDNDSANLECILELEHARRKMPSCCFEFLRQFFGVEPVAKRVDCGDPERDADLAGLRDKGSDHHPAPEAVNYGIVIIGT